MRKLDHIGIYVRSIEEASRIYAQLGFPVERVIQFEAGGRAVPIAFIPVGDGVDLELIEAPAAVDAGFEPLHHICFEVPDIASELDALAAAGCPLADRGPRPGAAARLIAFLEPAAAAGVRIELAEK
jgi:catechol 2,3-dioxygenase-like lactoylglutathione lyase family enzyme